MRNKLFTVISLFGISLTLTILIIGASFYDFTFKSNYPVLKQSRILYLSQVKLYDKKYGPRSYKTFHSGQPSYFLLKKCALPLTTPERVSIYSNFKNINSFINSRKAKLVVRYTDNNYWDILDFNLIAGRTYNKNESESAQHVAVIAESIADNYYGDPQSAIGKNLEADKINFKIIGVVENVPITSILSAYANIWVPVTSIKEDLSSKELHGNFNAMVLAKNRSDFPIIKDEFQRQLKISDLPMGIYKFIEIYPDSFLEMFIRLLQISISTFYFILTIIIFIIILIPSLNLINLSVNRISERISEIGIRKSFGANKIYLLGQFLIENIILTLIGGIIAIVFSIIFFIVINNTDLIPLDGLYINYRILLVGLFYCFCFGLISGFLPAYKMSHLPIVESLKHFEA